MLRNSKWLAAPLNVYPFVCLPAFPLPMLLLISTSAAATRGGAEQKVVAASSAR